MKQNTSRLKQCYDKCEKNLMEIVTMVRQDLSKVHRITLGVMVTIEVHSKVK